MDVIQPVRGKHLLAVQSVVKEDVGLFGADGRHVAVHGVEDGFADGEVVMLGREINEKDGMRT